MAYAKNDREAAKAARETMDAGSGTNWLKLKEGVTFIRPLPPHVNMKDPETGAHRFYHPVSLHFNIGPTGKVVPCPRKMLGARCAVCERAFALRNEGHEQAGNELLPSWQSYMNVLVFDADGDVVRDKDGNVVVYVWPASRGVLDQIFEEIEERESEQGGAFIDITDPKEGYILKVKKTGTKKENTKYRVTLAKESTDITDIEEEWAEELVDVTVLSPVLKPDQIVAILEGSEDDPFAKKQLPAASGKPQFDDDDEDIVDGEIISKEDDDEGAAAALQRMMDKKGKKKGSRNAR